MDNTGGSVADVIRRNAYSPYTRLHEGIGPYVGLNMPILFIYNNIVHKVHE